VKQDRAGRNEIQCDELLARHGDYLDGLLGPFEAARVQLHLELCLSCARYDRVVRRGMDIVRDLPEIAPSADFELRLQHRIFHVDDAAALRDTRSSAGTVATLAVAGFIALLAWSPVLITTEDGVAVTSSAAVLPAGAADALTHLPARTPLLSGGAHPWQPVHALSPLSNGETVRIMAAFPGPYSPLIVAPPVHGRSVRTISTEYSPLD
jgi:hypothetical protein